MERMIHNEQNMYPLLEIQNRDKGRFPFRRIYLGFGNGLRYWSPTLAICSLLQLAPPFSGMARFVGELQNPGSPVVFPMPYRLTTDFFPECRHRCHRNLCKSRRPGDRCCECIVQLWGDDDAWRLSIWSSALAPWHDLISKNINM